MTDINSTLVQEALTAITDEQVKNFREFETGAARTVLEVRLKSGRELIVYLCTKEKNAKRFKKEEKLLEEVNQNTGIPTPEIIYSDFSKKQLPYLLYVGKKINGYNPVNRYKYLPKSERNHILTQSAKYLAELHENVKFNNPGRIHYKDDELQVESTSTYQFITDWAEDWIEKMGETRFSDLQKQAYEFMEKYRALADSADTCCVHFDVRPENLLIKNGEIEAVLDWEKAISLAPEWDLQYSMILFIQGKIKNDSIRRGMMRDFFEAYLEERKLDDRWKKRMLYFSSIWTFKSMVRFEENIPEEDKSKVEKEFRQTFNERHYNLEKAAENQLPNNISN
jgi:aminoglycoside phosphotransferase (APT) family kinase protein